MARPSRKSPPPGPAPTSEPAAPEAPARRAFVAADRALPHAVAATAVGIAVCDVLAFAHPYFGKIGIALWLLSYLFLYRYAVARVVETLERGIRRRGAPILLVAALFLAALLAGAFMVRNTHIETFHETGCAIQQFFGGKDAGFHGVCHFGYPTRSYSLATVPTLLFGPSTVALNLGMALYGTLGLLFFSSGLVTSMGKRHIAGWLGALALCLLPQVHTALATFFTYEQSGYPVAWSLVLCGLLAHFEKRRGLEELALLALVGMHLAYSYTPVLPLLFAQLAIFVWLLRPGALPLPMRRYVYGAIALAALSFLLSLAQRTDIRLFQSVYGPKEAGGGLLLERLKHLLFQNQGEPFATAWAHVVTIAYLATAFAGRLGRWHFAVALWGTATIALAVSAAGVTRGNAAYGMFRMLAVVPVFAWAWARLLHDRLPAKRWAERAAVAAVIALLCWDTHQAVKLLSAKTPVNRLGLYQKINPLIPEEFRQDGYVLILLPGRDPYQNFGRVGEILSYFRSGAIGIELNISHCRLPMTRYPRQLRITYRGLQCAFPGEAEELGTFTHDGVEVVVQRLR